MRDFVCLHARLAVPDGLTHQPIYPLSPATADTAVAGQETCAHGAAHLPPGRRSDMSPTSHDSLARGHRIREFVCAYRTLRDDQGQAVRLPTKALSDPRIAAATLALLLASETVEVFAVACLSTRHQLLAWHVLLAARARARPSRFRTCSCPRASPRALPHCSSCTTTRAVIPLRARTMHDSRFGWRRRPTSSTCRCSIT